MNTPTPTQAKHTPGRIQVDSQQPDAIITDHGDGYTTLIAECAGNEANAARLAHCWNNHDPLLEALQAALPALEMCAVTCGNTKQLEQARAAIQAAIKGEA